MEKKGCHKPTFFKYLPLRGLIAGQLKDMMASGARPNDRLDLLMITSWACHLDVGGLFGAITEDVPPPRPGNN